MKLFLSISAGCSEKTFRKYTRLILDDLSEIKNVRNFMKCYIFMFNINNFLTYILRLFGETEERKYSSVRQHLWMEQT